MNCLKCGREIEENQVFCEECLDEAKEYPINPNTAIYLPKQMEQEPVKKQPRRRPVSQDEQLRQAKGRIRRLWVVVVVLVLLLAALSYPAYRYFTQDHPLVGQNYTPVVTIHPSASETIAQTTP